MVDPIHGNILDAKITSNEGVNPEDNPQLKPGAKDSIGREQNVTERFETSFSPKGPFGGMKT